jgi:hypothetical protein
MRRIAAPALAGLAVFAFAACSADEGDFASEAEGFIEEDDGDVATQLGQTFSDAACEEPASTDTNTTFACTAVGADGVTYDFLATISGENEFTISGGTPAAGGAAPAATTATTTG